MRLQPGAVQAAGAAAPAPTRLLFRRHLRWLWCALRRRSRVVRRGVAGWSGAGIGLLTSIANDRQLRDVSFWQLGSVGGATWPTIRAILPFVTVALVVLPRKARHLDLLVLGEREARHLGVNVERTRLTVIVLCALACGAAVAVAGILGVVGLIVPHLVRLVNGPGHRVLLPASALGGAAMLTFADLTPAPPSCRGRSRSGL